MPRGFRDDILAPVNTTNSSSPSIRRAAEEPENWRRGGEIDANKAIANNPLKTPINPSENK